MSDDAHDLAKRLDALGDLPVGTVGRAFHDFYTRNGFAWPLDDPHLIRHDCTHVLAGYAPVPEAEIALQAMLTAATGGRAHYPGLLASLLLFEVGMLPFKDFTPREGVLARPGAAALFGDSLARGARCGVDFHEVDFFALAERDLETVRDELHIDALPAGPFAFVV